MLGRNLTWINVDFVSLWHHLFGHDSEKPYKILSVAVDSSPDLFQNLDLILNLDLVSNHELDLDILLSKNLYLS